MEPNLQHAIERVERPGGSHEGVGRKKNLLVLGIPAALSGAMLPL